MLVIPRKSPVDPNNYRYIQLKNGFRALLVTTCDYESQRKKCAYTKRKKQRSTSNKKNHESCEQDTKRFDRLNLLVSNSRDSNPVGDCEGLSLLEAIVLLSTTKANPILLYDNEDNIPVEEFEEDSIEHFPTLTEKQKAKACQQTREYDMLACMSLCVEAGYFDDPPILKGAAHLLEHVFLLGCKKFPDPTYFDAFLEYTGGSPWNGNTDGSRTVYYFDTSADYLAESLDILSEHIKSPALNIQSIVHERETVDAEWRKAVPNHMFRFNHFLQMLSTPGHPYHTFSWGNKDSLSKINCDSKLRSVLMKFFKDHYSPNNMFFAIQAPETLERLETLVTRAFEHLPIREVCQTELDAFPMPFSNPGFRKLYKVMAVSKTRSLIVTWQLPAVAWKEYDVKPLVYIAYVLLNQNPGGLPHYLRHEGWITDVTANPTESNIECSDTCAIFSLHFTLTKSGLENYLKVLRALFSYIKMMIVEGPQFCIFAELVKIKAMEFHYLRESDSGIRIKELSEAMRVYKPEDVLSGPVLIRRYDADLIASITGLLKPDEANFMLFSKDFETECNRVEKYFGISYREMNFDCEELKNLQRIGVYKSFGFCRSNPFITTDFCLVEPDTPEDIQAVYPMRIYDPAYPVEVQPVYMWFFQDDNLVIPQANYLVTLNSPIVMDSALNAVMLDVFVTLLRDLFRGQSSSSSSAMLQVEMQQTDKGIHLYFAGFSQKLPVLLQELLQKFSALENEVEERRFQEARLIVLEDYENFLLEPCLLSSDVRKAVLYEKYWNISSRYATCANSSICTWDRFKIFAEAFKRRLHIRGYVGGNISRTQTRKIMSTFPTTIKYDPISYAEFPKSRLHLLPRGERCLRLSSYNAEGDTTAIKNVYQIGPASTKSKVIVDYIMEVIGEPLFNVLRTQKGLSYNPDIAVHEEFGVLTLQIHLLTQADKHAPHVVNQEVDDFLEKFYDLHISTLTEKKIDKLRMEVIESKELCISSPCGCEEVWEGVVEKETDLHYLHHEIEVWKFLTAKDIKDFFKKYLIRPSYVAKHYPEFLCKKNGTDYRKLSIQIVGFTSEERRKLRRKKEEALNFGSLKYLKGLRWAEEKGKSGGDDEDYPYFIEDITKFKETLQSHPPQF